MTSTKILTLDIYLPIKKVTYVRGSLVAYPAFTFPLSLPTHIHFFLWELLLPPCVIDSNPSSRGSL